MKWILMFLTVFASSSGDILCASGMSETVLPGRGLPLLTRVVRVIVRRRRVVLGGLCYAVAFFSMLGLLSVVPLSVAVPATAFSFVIDTLGAQLVLRERVPWKRWVGVACVSAGVILAVKPVPSAGAASAGIAAVQSHENQSCDHQ